MRSVLLGTVMAVMSTVATAATDEPICTDRPSKATGTCTVPAGRIQIETGLVDWTRDSQANVRTDLTAFGGSLIKYGLSDNADIEIGVTPLQQVRVRARGLREEHSSFGDTILRLKYRLTREDARVQVAIDPFVKLPTANKRLGNGQVEGGVAVPFQIALGSSPFTLSVDPELDLLADDSGGGRHAATQQVINVGLALNSKLSVSAELWGEWDWAPSGTARQASADAALAYDLSPDVQLDAGANFGLNRETPDLELYSGVSVRF